MRRMRHRIKRRVKKWKRRRWRDREAGDRCRGTMLEMGKKQKRMREKGMSQRVVKGERA